MKRNNKIAIGMRGLLSLALIFGLMGCGTSAKTPPPTETAFPAETPIGGPAAIPAESGATDDAPAKTTAPFVRTLPKGEFRIENNTTFSIHELYYALPGTFDWQENLLEDKAPLQSGDSVEFFIPGYADSPLDFCIITIEYILNAPASMPFIVTGRIEDIITLIDNDLKEDKSVPLPNDWSWE
jgi:hypothetical protein